MEEEKLKKKMIKRRRRRIRGIGGAGVAEEGRG